MLTLRAPFTRPTDSGKMAEEPRFERCVKQHEHPFGLGTQRGMWPAMRSFGEGYVCNLCSKDVGEGHLRCSTGCEWDLCGECAKASTPLAVRNVPEIARS